MNLEGLVIQEVRKFVHLEQDDTVFDSEIIPHIYASLGRLSQNGVGVSDIITDSTTWFEIINPDVVENKEVFVMIPLFVMMSCKLIFDPPPPSNVEYYKGYIDELLWRLRLTYDTRGGDCDG